MGSPATTSPGTQGRLTWPPTLLLLDLPAHTSTQTTCSTTATASSMTPTAARRRPTRIARTHTTTRSLPSVTAPKAGRTSGSRGEPDIVDSESTIISHHTVEQRLSYTNIQ